MTDRTLVALTAVIGLVAGIGHGIVSHQLDLPLSLVDQFLPPSQAQPLDIIH